MFNKSPWSSTMTCLQTVKTISTELDVEDVLVVKGTPSQKKVKDMLTL